MASEKQIDANRRNAQHSTGPNTSEGRAAVRLNSVKHGLTAETVVLPGESESDFDEFRQALEAEFLPATPNEELLVEQIVMARWRLRRLYRVEAAFFKWKLESGRQLREKYNPGLDDAGALAYLHNSDAGPNAALNNLSRYEGRLERTYFKALRELQRLRVRPTTPRGEEERPAPPPRPEIGFASQSPNPPPPPSQINDLSRSGIGFWTPATIPHPKSNIQPPVRDMLFLSGRGAAAISSLPGVSDELRRAGERGR